jgi:hypothetical protein
MSQEATRRSALAAPGSLRLAPDGMWSSGSPQPCPPRSPPRESVSKPGAAEQHHSREDVASNTRAGFVRGATPLAARSRDVLLRSVARSSSSPAGGSSRVARIVCRWGSPVPAPTPRAGGNPRAARRARRPPPARELEHQLVANRDPRYEHVFDTRALCGSGTETWVQIATPSSSRHIPATVRHLARRLEAVSAGLPSGRKVQVGDRARPSESRDRLYGAAPESNRPSVGLPHRTGFEDLLGHRAHAAPGPRLPRQFATTTATERVARFPRRSQAVTVSR